MEQVLIGNTDGNLDATSTLYYGFVGFLGFGTILRAEDEFLVSSNGALKKLRVELDGAPGDGKSYAFAILKNGSAVGTLSANIADAATSDEDAGSFAVTAGDRISIRVVPSGTPTTRRAKWTMVYEGDTTNESLIPGCNGSCVTSGTKYSRVMGNMAELPNEVDVRQICPTAGIIKNLYIKLDSDPGTAPDAYRFTVRLNKATVGESLIVTITADNTTGNDTSHNLAVVAGDVLTLMVEPLNTPSVEAHFSMGMTFVATTDGESVIMGGSGDTDNTATEYNVLCGWGGWTATEGEREQLAQVCTLKDFYVLLSSGPGTGNKYTFTVRESGGSSAIVVEIAAGATTGNDTAHDHTVADGDELALMVVPDSTPNVVEAYWGIVSYIEPAVTGIGDKSANMGAKMVAAGLI